MSIRTSYKGGQQVQNYLRKADQEMEMASLAGAAGDLQDAALHIELAREYNRLAEVARSEE